jgi:hypothetical protein
LGIKVDITFKNPSDDKEIIISRRIWIPAGRPVTENPEPLPQPEE